MSNVDELVNKINRLSISNRNIITELIEQLGEGSTNTAARASEIAPNRGVRQFTRRPNHNFISKNGVPLAPGDRVEILTTHKVGREGDIAEVSHFNKTYVALRILATGVNTQRASKYLDYIE